MSLNTQPDKRGGDVSGFFPAEQEAVLSGCGKYRYSLTRTWNFRKRHLCWVMLNPSIADATVNDPTVKKCVHFSKAFGFGGLRIVNLYALRSTDPKKLWEEDDPVGPENDRHIEQECSGSRVIVAWGANAKRDRVSKVVRLLWECSGSVDCLGVTKSGMPRHPLYLANATKRGGFVWEENL